jgi:TolB protein
MFMKQKLFCFNAGFLVCFVCFVGIHLLPSEAQAQQEINVVKQASALIPISISGFSGEAQAVLQFDLAVLGIKVTSDNPEYLISGNANGQLTGVLTTAGGKQVFSRIYSGGSARAQAHSFADDIVTELRQTAPIFHSRIAFRCQRGGANEIYVSDFDGHNPVQLTSDNTLVEGPSWAPGGRALFYASWKSGAPQILDQNLNTGGRRVFASGAGDSYTASISKDGREVAFISNRGGSPNLWVSDMGGGDARQLTISREEDSAPTWSPDGSEICFVHRSGRARLRKISATGGSSVPLQTTGAFGDVTSPDWSPDGKQIAFTVGSGNFSIWVVPAGGGEAKQLVAGEDPCWAPNSRTIIFSRQENNKHILCLLDVPTKAVKDVRQIPGSCSEPAWAR